METQICSGCQIPSYGVRVLIAMNHGFICVDCVKQSIEQIEVARQRDRVLERVRARMAHLLQLTEPRRPRWVTRLEVRELDVLAQQLDDLTSAYICSRGPFAVEEAPQVAPDAGGADVEDVAEGLSWTRRAGAFADDADVDEVQNERDEVEEVAGLSSVARTGDVANHVLRLVEPPSDASTPPEIHHVIAFVCETLNAELLDCPTPNMVQYLERHEIDVDDDFRIGITSMRDELRRRCDFLDPRSQLTLVRGSDAAQTAPPSEASWAERYAAPHQVSIPVESRCWIERLEAWISSVNLTPEILAKRANRDRATVVSLFRQTDRQTSLRRFLDLVRGANACLCGVPDATPAAVFRRLREIVSEQGLSIATLAQRSGINRSQLSSLFNRPEPNPNLWTVQRIVVALNCVGEMMLVASSPRQDVEAPISIPAHAIKALVAQLKESDRSLDAALNEVERRVRERPR